MSNVRNGVDRLVGRGIGKISLIRNAAVPIRLFMSDIYRGEGPEHGHTIEDLEKLLEETEETLKGKPASLANSMGRRQRTEGARYRSEWDHDAKLRTAFPIFNIYAAYRKYGGRAKSAGG